MKNLLIIAQKVDINDDLLGSFMGWLKEFSKYFARVEVIALAKGEYDLPDNVFVHSLGKERGNSRLARIINFYKLLFQLVPRSAGIFAHMSPIFAVAAWPAAFIFRKKIILWYLHRAVTWRLRLAEKLCFKIVTASQKALFVKSRKILELGHGLDTERFRNEKKWDRPPNPWRLISVGRISRIKNFETVIKAAKILKDSGLDFSLKIIGRPVRPDDRGYFEELKLLINNLGLEKSVVFVGFVPYKEILPYYLGADMAINALPFGGMDKTVLEAMAGGLLVLTSNEVFGKTFGRYAADLLFDYRNENDLAEKIVRLFKLPTEAKINLTRHLRDEAVEFHGQDKLVSKISGLFP